LSKLQFKDLAFLDALRGIAAFIVLVGHARWLLWEGFSSGYLLHESSYAFFEKLSVYFLSLFKFGHQAVMFFFLLSGFVIHLKYSKNIAEFGNSTFSFLPYIKNRFKRIYPPLLFALLLTFILDLLGSRLGFLIYQKNTPIDLINNNVNFNHSFINLLGNLLLFANSKVEIWGSNSPMWSLKLEWWIYLVYPIFIYLNSKSINKGFAFVLGLLILSFFISDFSFLNTILKSFLFWFIGTLLADIYTNRIKIKHSYLSMFIVCIPLVLLFPQIAINDFVNDLFWVIGFFGLLNTLFYLQNKGVKINFLRKLKWLGDCSYTIYIIHFPILVFFNGLLLYYYEGLPKSQWFIYLSVIIIVAISYGLHFLIEKPFAPKKK
jgi:peptidoglycan/LPS O-acetylase OafA/YrhL